MTDKRLTETDLSDELLDIVGHLLTELHSSTAPPAGISLDSSLDRELGLDSLSRIELLSRIEDHFDLLLPENSFAEAETPRDLLRELSRVRAHSVASNTSQINIEKLTTTDLYPSQAHTLIDMLQWHARNHADRPHIQIYTDQGDGAAISYGELYGKSKIVAAGLQQIGLQPGDAVTLMLPTDTDYFYAFFGILLAGGIPVPIYPPTRPNQLEDHMRRHATILINCRAIIMITVPKAKPVALLLRSHVESLRHIVTVDDLLADGRSLDEPAISAEDTAFLQYTSGSTGNPKGVVLTHANVLANIRSMGSRVHANSNDVFVSWLPLYHDMGLIGAWLGSLYYASLFVVMSPLSFLARPQRWLQAIHHYHGTLSAAPNFGYELCLHRLDGKDLQGLDLSSWRSAFNGAEAVNPDTVLQFPRRFSQFGFSPQAMMPVYGLAESCVGLAFPPIGQGVKIDHVKRQVFMRTGHAIPADRDDTNPLRFVACGQPLTGHEIRIVDEQGDELPERYQGCLQFRGPSATSGYLHNPEATQKLFVDDWLDSGDLAYLGEGDIYITGRIKDVVIRAGRNLYPHELEEAVGDIADIRKGRVAVFGARDANSSTERLVVLAETRQQDSVKLSQMREQINAIANDLLGGPADDIVLAPPQTVLKTSSGKVRRSACRDLYEQGFIHQSQTPVWQQASRLLITSAWPQIRRLRNNFAHGLWSLHAKFVFNVIAVFAWLIVVLSPISSVRWSVMRASARLLARLTNTSFRVAGGEHIPDLSTPCIFVSNHASYLDGPALIAAIDRPFSFIAKVELRQQFIAGTFLRRIQTEFVERFDVKKGVEDANRIAAIAQTKRSLFFFPEGTFTRIPGLLPFHLGAFLTAAKANLPIVPIAIRGTRSILRADTKQPRHGSVTITIGTPIYPRDLANRTTSDIWGNAIALRDATRVQILRHCGEPDLGQE